MGAKRNSTSDSQLWDLGSTEGFILLLSAVGSEWQLGGFAPTASNGFIGNSGGPLASGPPPSVGSTSQLVQAMAGFGGGAADTSNAAPIGADTSQQTFLTIPHA